MKFKPRQNYSYSLVDCKTTGCNEQFEIVLDFLGTHVTSEVEGLEIKGMEVENTFQFDDYYVVECPSGHQQRVYIKYLQDGKKKVV